MPHGKLRLQAYRRRISLYNAVKLFHTRKVFFKLKAFAIHMESPAVAPIRKKGNFLKKKQ